MEKEKGSYNVVKLMGNINKSNDIDTIIINENKLFCLILCPALLLLSVSNFIIRFIVLQEGAGAVLADTLFFLLFGILFAAILKPDMKLKLFINLTAILYACVYLYVFIRFNSRLGPLIWIAAFIHLLIAMFQIKKNMLIINGSVILLTGIWLCGVQQAQPFRISSLYYNIMILMFILLLISASVLQKFNLNRYIKKLNFMAFHDGMTELPNREMVYKKLEQLIHNMKIPKIYVVYIDIDFFKNINDTMGHDAGDCFISAVAKRIGSVVNKEDLLGRMGGDEFILIIPQNISESEVFKYMNKIKSKFEEGFPIFGHLIYSTASFGIAVYPGDGTDAATLIKKSDMAMYRSKGLGKNNIQFFDTNFS